jgi:hypothetical protein
MTDMTISMHINSEKKHSVRYDANTSESAITSVYVMKTSLPKPTPQKLTITIKMENE